MTVRVEITGHSGFTVAPTVVVPQAAQQTVTETKPQGKPERPTLRLVR